MTRLRTNNAGVVSLLSGLWLLISLAAFTYWRMVPQALIDDDLLNFHDNPITYITQPLAVCGVFLAPIPPFLFFAFLHGNYQRRRVRSRIPARITLWSLVIAVLLNIIMTLLQTHDLFSTQADVGQSLFTAPGIWLALASMLALRQGWLPRIISLAGFFTGAGFACLNLVNFETDTEVIFNLISITIASASVWAISLGHYFLSTRE